MKLNKFVLFSNPKVFHARLKGLHPYYYYSALLAKKYGGNIKTIIDVGASVGDYSKACKSVFPKAEIHAFEPSPSAVDVLKKKNFLSAYDLALTNKNGKINFNFDDGWDSTSSLLDFHKDHKRFGTNLKKITVSGKRFDSLNIDIKRPCFAKVEVEGAEVRVLEGFGERLKEVDVLNITYNFLDKFSNQSRLSEIAKLTERAGFNCFVQTYLNEKKGCEFYFFRS